MPLAKRHFYNNRDYIIDMENHVVILKEHFHKMLISNKLWGRFGFKKIGGSTFGDVLEVDLYKSQFRAFINICRLDMPILDMKYINAGQVIEGKVIDLILAHPNVDTIETFPAKKYNYDYFPNVPIFGGLPDGLEQPHDLVIEIKTTNAKNYESWKKDGPPISYLKQAMLYTYLMKKKHFAIVVTFLEDEDYANPEQYNIKERKTRTFPFMLDEQQIKDDIDVSTSWYKHHTKIGTSPRFNLKKDGELLEYLLCENKQQYEKLIDKWDKDGKINWPSLGGK